MAAMTFAAQSTQAGSKTKAGLSFSERIQKSFQSSVLTPSSGRRRALEGRG